MGSAAAEPSEVALRIAVDARPLNQKFSGIGQYLEPAPRLTAGWGPP